MKGFIGSTVFILLSVYMLKAQPQLSPPVLSVSRAFINSGTTLSMHFRMKGATIHYTTDGTMPNISSPIYTAPLTLEDAAAIHAKTFHKDFTPSEPITAQFYKVPKIAIQITGTPPDPNYPGAGLTTLTDRMLGDDNFRKYYVGYNADEITLEITNPKNEPLKTLHLSYLINQGAWIFGPSKIEIIQHDKVIKTYTVDNCLNPVNAGNNVIAIPIRPHSLPNFKVKIYPVMSIPEWHGGKGNRGWVFLDEVWVE